VAGHIEPVAFAWRSKPLSRPNWSRPLPQPLVIPKVTTLGTLADMRELTRHLLEDHRSRSTWHRVAADIETAADGGDIEGAAIALRLVLMLEGIERRPQ
jgi:hypothetical protein